MTGIPGFFAAFAAGFLSFLSPCILPLIPAYLSYITGESVATLKAGTSGKRGILARALLFVLGFTLIFMLLGIVFGGGMKIVGNGASSTITKVAGVLVIVLAINMIFDFIPFLRREIRVDMHASHAAPEGSNGCGKNPAGALFLGMAFAAGWTPCVGPILSSILFFAGSSGNVLHAAVLLVLYAAGLGIPFILAGLFLDRVLPALGIFRRHAAATRIVTAALLILLAVPMLTGNLAIVTASIMKAGYSLENFAETGPLWLRPAAALLARWLTFSGS